jgi:Putative DNA-binding domain
MTAARLERFQDEFARALLAADCATAGLAPEVVRLAAQPGFAVYRNTVMKGCIDALQANYPSVARLVGDEWFRAAAAMYARANLPRHPTLADYGADFADFLAAFAPAAELPYLAGVARLDRFWTEAHTARDQASLDVAAVAHLTPSELARTVLQPHASARWAWFDAQPIVTIWRRNRYPDGADDGEIEWRGEGVLVVRPQAAVEHVALDAAACAFLDASAAGRPLADAAAAALAASTTIDLARLMARLLDAGAVGGLDILAPDPEEHSR